MAKENQDIGSFDDPVIRGDDETVEITVLKTDGTAKSITGASIEWEMYERYTRTSVVSKSTTDGDITITDGANGVFEIAIDGSDTQSLDGGRYKHEAEVTDSAGTTKTVTRGTVYLSEDTA